MEKVKNEHNKGMEARDINSLMTVTNTFNLVQKQTYTSHCFNSLVGVRVRVVT